MTEDKAMQQDQNGTFGWGPISPKFLKGCKKLSYLAVCLIFCSFFNGINLGALSVALTSLEKRYGFSSKVTGLVAATANIGSVITIIFLAPLGSHSHKPRMLACGAVVTAVSCLLRVMPHLLDGPLWSPDTVDGFRRQHPLCQKNGNNTSCSKPELSDGSAYTALAFLLIGQLVGGAGFSQIISFAPGIFTEHLDDKKSGHAYIAASNVLGAVGVSAGFLLGSVCLTIFVDIRTPIYIDYSNQEWIGAWWLMFVFSGSFLLIFSLILFAFPARVYDHFARENLLDEERDFQNESARGSSFTSQQEQKQGNLRTFLQKCKSFPASLLKLVKNPAFSFLNICSLSELFFLSGLCAFGAKTFEKDFDIPAADAGLIMGTIIAAGAVGGILGGGFVINKLGANPRAMARTCAVCSLLAAACSNAYFFRCDETRVAGIHMFYNHTSFQSDMKWEASQLIDGCNAHCDCHISTFTPVCGPDDITYFSACHAGCDFAGIDRNKLMLNFTNCACVRARSHRQKVVEVVDKEEHGKSEPDSKSNPSKNTGFTVTDGKCLRKRCNRFYPFFVIFLFGIFVRAVIIPPLTVLILKCVPDDEKVFALGANFLSTKILGAIPGPIVLGALIDKTCLIWQETCENTGHCWMYKITDLNMHLGFIWLGTSIVSIVTSILASLFVPGAPSSPTTQEQKPTTDIIDNKDNQKPNTDIADDKDDQKPENSDEIYEPIEN